MRVKRIRRRSRHSTGTGASTRSLAQLLGPFVRPHRIKLVAIALAAFVSGLVEAAILVLISRTALAIASDDGRFIVKIGSVSRSVTVRDVLIVAGVLVLVRVGIQALQAQLTVRTFTEIGRQTRRRLVDLYLGSAWALQSVARPGFLQELVSNVAPSAARAGHWLVNGVVAGLSLTALVVTAFAVNAVASIAVAALALLLAACFGPLRRAVRRRARRSVDANLALGTTVTEVAGLAQEIRIFEVEPVLAGVVGARVDTAAQQQRSLQLLADVVTMAYQGAALGLVVVALGVVDAASFSRLSALSAVVLIMLRSLSYGQALQRAVQGVHEAAPSLELLTDEMERLEAAQVPRDGEPVTGIGTITFEGVSFAYAGDQYALRDVSFETRRGEVIGIVGPSGAGKSTLMQLILRLRHPSEGRVLADGRDVSRLSLHEWYHHVTFVPQEAHLFAGSIAENIRFFRPDVADDQVVEAAKLANFHDEVMARPGGYASPVGEQGGELSGGQRQRLCIARALVERPDVLVLDEPTSSLDLKSEALIRDALVAVSGDTTIFIIAHRMSTLAICDRIMVIQAGSLLGFDAPERLAETTPLYREALDLAGLK